MPDSDDSKRATTPAAQRPMDVLPISTTDHGDWTVARLEEASLMDAAVVEALSDHVDALIAKGRKKLILDFEKVQYISSSMIGVLVGARQSVTRAKGEIILCSLNHRLVELLRLTRLHKMFTVEATLPEAKKRAGIPG